MATGMIITVREAEERDIDFLVDLNRIVHELHLAAEPAFFQQPEPGAVAELFRSRLQQPDVRVYIASVEQAPIGHAVAVMRERPASALSPVQRYCDLEELGVLPSSRKKGVARALVERVVADAHDRGVREVLLTCWSFNAAAQAAFRALGFRPMTVRFQRSSD